METSYTVKPDTPVVVKLVDATVCLHASMLDKIPTFSAQVRALKATKQADGAMRADIALPLCMRDAARLLSKACGGVMDPNDYMLLTKYSMTTQNDQEVFLAAFTRPRDPQPRIIEKDAGSAGAITALCLKGPSDACISSVIGAGAKATFALPSDAPDSPYNANTHTLMPSASNEFLVTRAGDLGHTLVLKVEFAPRTDASEWSPSVLDTMFEAFEYSIGGSTFDKLDLSVNNAMAKAYRLWPHANNAPPANPRESWVATIPVMISETSHYKDAPMPIVAMFYHEIRLRLCNVRRDLLPCPKFALDIDYVYLDTTLRRYIAQGDQSRDADAAPSGTSCCAGRTGCHCCSPPVEPKPVLQVQQAQQWDSPSQWTDSQKSKDGCMRLSDGPAASASATAAAATAASAAATIAAATAPVSPAVAAAAAAAIAAGRIAREEQAQAQQRDNPTLKSGILVAQHFSQKFEVPVDASVVKETINMGHPCGGLIITMRSEIDAPAKLADQVVPIVSASISINNNPFVEYDTADLTEFNWLKTGMESPRGYTSLLVPFSRDMFSGLASNSRVNLSRTDSVVLRLTVNKAVSFMKWSGVVTALTTNVRKTVSGMCGLNFCT